MSKALNIAPTNINAVIIVAAGRGERAGQSNGPKQYRQIYGKSVLQQTVSAFTEHKDIDLVQVVIHADDVELYAQNVDAHKKLAKPCIGGASRQSSVLCGLKTLSDKAIGKVLIHDAARPFLLAELISRVLDETTPDHGALPVLPLTDTIKRGSDNMVLETVSRHDLYAAQTPQGFFHSVILAAHEKAAQEPNTEFTDDASIAEWTGIPVHLVEGDPNNSKLTVPEDFAMAEKTPAPIIPPIIPDVRTGNGYDVHAFEAGDHVRLCGVDIPHNAKLKGHSDADVGLHALTDALLGTMADGDIGSHFPPSDPKWKDADSEVFFRHAIKLIEKRGGTITHVDTTLICEMPKIGPHRDKMRAEIARMAEISIDRISVKATTNERLGFVGREEGIAAIATATVIFGG